MKAPKKIQRKKSIKRRVKASSRRTHLIYILPVLVIPIALIFYFIPKSLDILATSLHQLVRPIENSIAVKNSNTISEPQQIASQVGMPVRLKIPKLNIDSPILAVGLDSNGAMDSPEKPADAGWFELGVRPGDVGSAVIAGHYGWRDGIPALFDNLSSLRPGDKIYVEDSLGSIITFVVRESKVYGENDDTSGVFGSIDGKAHLNLITCGGTYDKSKKSYSTRLVVFADKER